MQVRHAEGPLGASGKGPHTPVAVNLLLEEARVAVAVKHGERTVCLVSSFTHE